MKELQTKYKDDLKKLNEQMMGLYQKEGVESPGRLPAHAASDPGLLRYAPVQHPVRPAAAPCSYLVGYPICHCRTRWHWGLSLPLVNWTDLRILPFLMVGTQIWTSMLSQPPGGSTGQMKIMTYGLPFIFLLHAVRNAFGSHGLLRAPRTS